MKSISLRVDATKTLHTMAYGFGYNLHVIGDIWDEPIDVNILGSAFGGVPDSTDAESWARILAHADWLGFEFIRLIIDQRMYEPDKKGVYTWQGDAMKRLYLVLDWCQSRDVDVLLFEQWHGVAWNAIAGFDKWTSSPADIEAYAASFTTLVEKLVKERGYACIRAVGFNNENFHDAGGHDRPAKELVRAELDRKGISLPLAGPDDCRRPAYAPDVLFGVYENHAYPVQSGRADYVDWIKGARGEGKHFFLGEFGGIIGNDTAHDFDFGLNEIGYVITMINAGCDGFAHWSFFNRGDIDGAWQVIDTWDPTAKRLLPPEKIRPRPFTYWLHGMLQRFTVKRSDILKITGGDAGIQCAALRSPAGNYTLLAANTTGETVDVQVVLKGCAPGITFHRYSIAAEKLSGPDFKLQSTASFLGPSFRDVLPASSFTVYSTYLLDPEVPGMRIDEPLQDH
jgi:hypothetical protein